MAGKAKSVYLLVTPIGSIKSVLSKMFFDAKAFNEFVKSDEFKAKYPATEFQVIKVIY